MNSRIIRFLFGATVALAIASALLVLPTPAPVRAGGAVTSCNEAGLDAALSGGGTVSFNCGGTNSPATITLTSQKTISVSTTINGGSVITLSGGNSTSLFLVNSSRTLTLNAITITQGQTSGNGGCLYVNGTLVVNDTIIAHCQATGVSSRGGAIFLALIGTRATLVNTSVLTNSASSSGGGILNSGTMTLTNVTLSGNSSSYGGGVFNFDLNALAKLTNVTLTANSATANGGGFYNDLASAALTNVTLSANSAITQGGGIYNVLGSVAMSNTIVSNSPLGGNCYPTLGGNSNLSSDNTCGFGAGRDSITVMLGPLANNGGATQTHALLPGSPAIDFGTNSGCPSTDQRGKARPVDGDKDGTATCDVGAYEGYLEIYLPLILK